MERIKLIEPSMDYEDELLSYIKEFQYEGETIHGGSKIEHKKSIAHWIESVEKNKYKETVEYNLVPSLSLLLVRESDNRLLGLSNIRLDLNDFLLKRGGNIGYSIRKNERGKGYGSEILRLSLEKCRENGLKRVLLTCDKDNLASVRIIQKNGGILENEVDIHGKPLQRYWIDI